MTYTYMHTNFFILLYIEKKNIKKFQIKKDIYL